MTPGLAAAMLLQGSLCLASPPAEPRAELKAAYQQWVTAYRERDFSTMEKMLSSDVKWKQLGGATLNRAQSMAFLKRQRSAITNLKALTFSIDRIAPRGATIVATTSSRFQGVSTGDDGRAHTVDMIGISYDTWIKSGPKWRVRMIEDRYEGGTIDGRRVSLGRKP